MPRDEYREERLVRVLREQLYETVEGVQEAVIVTNDGLVVAAYPGIVDDGNNNDDADRSQLTGALAAEIIAQSRRAMARLAQGEINRIMIEGEPGSMIVVPAGDQAALAVMVDNQAKLGITSFQIARVAPEIGGLLD